jgi:hypothetical protein
VFQIIKVSAKNILSGKLWLQAPEGVVLKILQLPSMPITEKFLFSSLLNWGRAQVKDKLEVRAKIENCLKHIRFCSMDYAEFSNLCCVPIPLTAEEKYKIFLSITQKNSKHLPEGFSTVKKPRCIEEESTSYDWISLKSSLCTNNDLLTKPVIVNVTVKPLRYLTGLLIFSLTGVNAGDTVHLSCAVYSSEHPKICIASATFNDVVPKGSRGELYFDWPVLMKMGISYRIELNYIDMPRLPYTYEYLSKSTSYSWYESDPKEKVTVLFALNKPVKPITDICGLIMAKIMA